MNELIAKLYDQAIVIENGGDYVAGELDPEKFAELIVKECCVTADANIDDSKYPSYWIKRKFGVKE